MYGSMMVHEVGSRGDTDIVHIDSYCGSEWFVLEDNITIDEVHHRLEGRWGVGETEVHHRRFEESVSGFKCCLVFVSITNSYVIIPPSDVEFGVYMSVA